MSAASLTASVSVTPPMLTASGKSMRHTASALGLKSVRSRQTDSAARTNVGERVIAFLRQRHPIKTADNVAADSGVPAGTVQKWLDRGSAPSVVHFARLVSAYGPDVAALAFASPPAWLDHAQRTERAAILRAEIAAREAMLARL